MVRLTVQGQAGLSTTLGRLPSCIETGTGAPPYTKDDGFEVVVDFREPDRAELLADRAKELYDQGLLIKEIAARLDCHRNLVSKALKAGFARHGQVATDGRARRATLRRKHCQPPTDLFQSK